ncbi:MAG TPA: hypothetical protein VLA36_09660 [Longimicrobiales bacterium]|nr:hypothetical protein [Longimicrobiales bacterium]
MTRRTREVALRAVRRLAVFEWVLLLGAMLVALVGGGVVAALLSTPLGVSFRGMWAVASLLMFVVPGGFALRRARQAERAVRPLTLNDTEEPDV